MKSNGKKTQESRGKQRSESRNNIEKRPGSQSRNRQDTPKDEIQKNKEQNIDIDTGFTTNKSKSQSNSVNAPVLASPQTQSTSSPTINKPIKDLNASLRQPPRFSRPNSRPKSSRNFSRGRSSSSN